MSKSTRNTPKQSEGSNQDDTIKFDSARRISEDNASMVAAITEDYRAGRITIQDGWIISETEASNVTNHTDSDGASSNKTK